jgi:superfamily II DNA/RNA helicase
MALLRLNSEARVLLKSLAERDKKAPGFSTKLERLEELFGELTAEDGRKIVLFSEWTTMLNLIGQRIERFKLNSVRLDGSAPQKKRQQLVHQFQHDPTCRLFLATNAGATGLNLQAANTVVNVDLPWNPALLEQRIARAHRMGQKNLVQVYLLVTEQTIEEKLRRARYGIKGEEGRARLRDGGVEAPSRSAPWRETARRGGRVGEAAATAGGGAACPAIASGRGRRSARRRGVHIPGRDDPAAGADERVRHKLQVSSNLVSMSAWSVINKAGHALPSHCRTRPHLRV